MSIKKLFILFLVIVSMLFAVACTAEEPEEEKENEADQGDQDDEGDKDPDNKEVIIIFYKDFFHVFLSPLNNSYLLNKHSKSPFTR